MSTSWNLRRHAYVVCPRAVRALQMVYAVKSALDVGAHVNSVLRVAHRPHPCIQCGVEQVPRGPVWVELVGAQGLVTLSEHPTDEVELDACYHMHRVGRHHSVHVGNAATFKIPQLIVLRIYTQHLRAVREPLRSMNLPVPAVVVSTQSPPLHCTFVMVVMKLCHQ